MRTTESTDTRPDPEARRPPGWLTGSAVIVAGSLVLGAATSWAQGVLPAALASFANSVSGWSICTALLVAALRPTLLRGALWGAVGFVCLVLGYTVGSQVRGFTYDPTLWGAVGLVAGPFVGAAAASVVGAVRTPFVAVGSGLLSGVLVGDGIYGLTVVASSTSPVYWTVVLVAGVVLLLTTAAVRLRAIGPIALQVATCFVAATVLVVGLQML